MSAIRLAVSTGIGLASVMVTLWLLGGHPVGASGTIRYVAVGGANTGDCSNAAAPCLGIQYAINQAQAGDEIRMAAGSYAGSQLITVDATTNFFTVVYISKTLTLRGGFTTANWTTPDPATNVTIINAAGAGRGVTIYNEQAFAEPLSVTLAGLTIRNGNYTGFGAPNALLCGQANQSCGGGVYAYAATLILQQAEVVNNRAGTDPFANGGGVFLRFAQPGTLFDRVTLRDNRAATGGGGGLYAFGSELVVRDSTFVNNTANDDGGAAYVSSGTDPILFDRVTFEGNVTEAATGGAGGAFTGDISLPNGLVLRNTTFRANTGRVTAAATVRYSGPVGASGQFENMLFASNVISTSNTSGAVVHVSGFFNGGTFRGVHLSAVDNVADNFVFGSSGSTPGLTTTVWLTNTLVVSATNFVMGHEPAGTGDVAITAKGLLFFNVGSPTAIFGGAPTFTIFTPVSGDPLLDAQFRPQLGSPAIDAGVASDVLTDFFNYPRGPLPDIGYAEYVAPGTGTATPTPTLGAPTATPTAPGGTSIRVLIPVVSKER